MNLEDLSGELRGGTIRPVYLLGGDEPLLRDDAWALLREAILDGKADDWNLQRLSGSGLKAGELVDAVRTLPVLAARRVVLVSEPEAARGAAGKALLEALVLAVELVAGQPETVLVVASKKPDRRARWVKAIEKAGARIECSAPTRAPALLSFAVEEARRQGVDFDRDALQLLVERIGPQLLALRREIEKAALLVEPGRRVERGHVEASTEWVAEQPIWDLTDAIGEGRGALALRVLGRLVGTGTPAPVILGALASHFRRLARVRGGTPPAGPPFVRRKLEGQARRYSAPRLRACLDAIHRADTALKGAGQLPSELTLERLVLSLVG